MVDILLSYTLFVDQIHCQNGNVLAYFPYLVQSVVRVVLCLYQKQMLIVLVVLPSQKPIVPYTIIEPINLKPNPEKKKKDR